MSNRIGLGLSIFSMAAGVALVIVGFVIPHQMQQ